MIRLSIRRKIIAIALILIVLMTITALLSMALVMQVSARLEDLTQSYVPAYGALARADIDSFQRALTLRRMIIEKNETPADDEKFAALRKSFEASGAAVDRETKTARSLIDGLIEKGSRFGDTIQLVQLGNRLSDLVDDTRVHLNDEIARLLPLLGGSDQKALAEALERVDALRDELDRQLDAARTNMIELLRQELGGDGAQAADGPAHRYHSDGAGCRFRAGVFGHRQQRFDTPGASPPRRGARRRGRKS